MASFPFLSGPKTQLAVGIILIGLLAGGLSACQGQAASVLPSPTSPLPTATAGIARDPAQAEIWQAWERSPHAQTYGVSKGSNTYCAKCHSPANWVPSAAIDPPPNCVSCKFPFDEKPRVAVHNTLVPEAQWENIGCKVCHRVEDGLIQKEALWMNGSTGYYETVASSGGVCEKCHTDTDTLRHKRDLSTGAHADYPCIQCHDPHSTVASCAACHGVQMEAGPQGEDAAAISHSVLHGKVACIACHDASGLEVGPLEDGSLWMPFRTVTVNGRPTREAYQSHTLTLKVDCARCHFAGNPWNLSIQASESQP